MKPTTEVWLAMRVVGAKDLNPTIESMTVEDAIKKMMMFTLENRMPQRFQYSIGYSKEEVIIGIGLSQTLKQVKRTEMARGIADMIAGLDMSKYED